MDREKEKTRAELIEELQALGESIARQEENEDIFRLFRLPRSGRGRTGVLWGAQKEYLQILEESGQATCCDGEGDEEKGGGCSSPDCRCEHQFLSGTQRVNGNASRHVPAMARLARISSRTSMEEIFLAVAKEARDLFNAESALISVFDRVDGTFLYKAVAGSKAMVCLGERMSLGEATVSGWILRQNSYFCSENISSDLRVDRERRELLGIETAIGAPLLKDGEVFGAVALINRTDGKRYSRKEAREILIPYSLFAGMVLERANAKQYSESIFDSAPFPIFEMGRDHEVLSINRLAEQTFGASSRHAIPDDLATDQWESSFQTALEESRTITAELAVGSDSQTIESFFVPFSWNRDGRVRSVMAYLVGLAGETG